MGADFSRGKANVTPANSKRCSRLHSGYSSPCVWCQLPMSLRQPHSSTSFSILDSSIPAPITSFSFDSPLLSSITPSLFHTRLKTYLFHKSFSQWIHFFPPDCIHGLLYRQLLLSNQGVFFIFSLFSVSWVPCIRLSWPFVSF